MPLRREEPERRLMPGGCPPGGGKDKREINAGE